MKNFIKLFLLLIQFSWMSNAQEFKVESTSPEASTLGISISQNISITFSDAINTANITTYPKVYVNKASTPINGIWTVSNSNKTLTFNSNENYPYGGYVRVKLNPEMRSANNLLLDADYDIFGKAATRYDYGFLVEYENTYVTTKQDFNNIAPRTVDGTDHNLTLLITYPVGATEKTPVHLFVHGGAWNGGTIEKSNCWQSPYDEYLAKNLGIASVDVSYRCKGSNGNFTQAMEDIQSAYDWVLANADAFNLDVTKIFFSGGSAGTPLASLSSQRLPVKAFVGFNGKYDFVNEVGDNFPRPNYGYQSNVPSDNANSAIHNLSSPPPPVLLLHGDNDISINIRQSEAFANAVQNAGSIGKLVAYPGEPHAFFYPSFEEFGDTAYETAKFLKELGLYIEAPKSDTYYFDNVGANLRMKSNSANNDVISATLDNNDLLSQWTLVSADNGYVFIQNKSNNMRLQGTSANTGVQTSVKLVAGSSNGDWVKWKLTSVGSNWFIDNRAHNTRLGVNTSGEIIVSPITETGMMVQWGSNNTLSISEINTESPEILIYPNSIKSGDDFNLHYTAKGNDANLKISIIDVSGKVISTEEKNIQSGLNKLKIKSNGLSHGLYFVELNAQGIKNTKKIIIK